MRYILVQTLSWIFLLAGVLLLATGLYELIGIYYLNEQAPRGTARVMRIFEDTTSLQKGSFMEVEFTSSRGVRGQGMIACDTINPCALPDCMPADTQLQVVVNEQNTGSLRPRLREVRQYPIPFCPKNFLKLGLGVGALFLGGLFRLVKRWGKRRR